MTTALQVTNFNFYGDELIALRDNSTGEIYTAINAVLRGIGFNKDSQLQYQRDKWIDDHSISKGVVKFTIPTKRVNQETYCIDIRRLPIALAKINITKRLLRDYPDISEKLELYQDKCADVLASVFIDHKSTNELALQPILESLNTFTQTVNSTLLSLNERIYKLEETLNKPALPKKKFSYWSSKMFPKYELLKDYFEISNGKLYQQLYWEFQNLYPDIDINQIKDDYCYENKLETCFTLDAIEHNIPVRELFENMVDDLLEEYELIIDSKFTYYKTIFNLVKYFIK